MVCVCVCVCVCECECECECVCVCVRGGGLNQPRGLNQWWGVKSAMVVQSVVGGVKSVGGRGD